MSTFVPRTGIACPGSERVAASARGAAIRTALLANQPAAVAQVAQWLHRQWFDALGYSPTHTEALLRRRLNRDQAPLALVALAGREPVGTAAIVEDELPVDGGPAFCLSGVYVLPHWRGAGIGARLCRRAQREARRLKLASLGLYTSDCQAYYAGLGWAHRTDTWVQGGAGPEPVSFMEFIPSGRFRPADMR